MFLERTVRRGGGTIGSRQDRPAARESVCTISGQRQGVRQPRGIDELRRDERATATSPDTHGRPSQVGANAAAGTCSANVEPSALDDLDVNLRVDAPAQVTEKSIEFHDRRFRAF
jgi:hypothetical protein